MDDPWGTPSQSQDPWAIKPATTSISLDELDKDASTSIPTTRARRSSSVADPWGTGGSGSGGGWGTAEATLDVSDGANNNSNATAGGFKMEMPKDLGMVLEKKASSWGEDDTGGGWGAPASPQFNTGIGGSMSNGGGMVMPTELPKIDFRKLEISAIPVSVEEDDTSTAPIPYHAPTPSYPIASSSTIANKFTSDDSNPFSTTEAGPSSPSPSHSAPRTPERFPSPPPLNFSSHLTTPTNNLYPTSSRSRSQSPSSPTFSDGAGFGGFSSAGIDLPDPRNDALPSWGPVGGAGGSGGGGGDVGWGTPPEDKLSRFIAPIASGGGGGGFGEDDRESIGDDNEGNDTDDDRHNDEEERENRLRRALSNEVEVEEVDAWGSSLPKTKKKEGKTKEEEQEDEWVVARQLAERREKRAPPHIISELENGWREVADQLYPPPTSTKKKKEGDEAGEEVEEQAQPPEKDTLFEAYDEALNSKRDALMDTLTSRPPALNTFIPPLNTTTTYDRYQRALSESTVNNTHSLLAQAQRIRTRRADAVDISEFEKEWNVRSRLGEPDADLDQALVPSVSQEDSSKAGWSLWGRKASGAPSPVLMTSGGGILERKIMTPVDVTGANPMSPQGTGASGSTGMVISPISVNPASILPTRTSATGSRPASPAVVVSPAATNNDNNNETSPDPGEQPSGLGRFFGRFRKNRPASASVDLSNKDLQLTSDDFSFLAEVPSITPGKTPEPGIGDLLSLSGSAAKRDEISSLENMLNSKAVPLPNALAPPPMPNRSVSGMSSSSKEVDLFADLDFGMDSSTSPIATVSSPSKNLVSRSNTASANRTVDSWDDFLSGPSNPSGPIRPSSSSSSIPPPSHFPLPLSNQGSRSQTPSLFPGPPPPKSAPAPPILPRKASLMDDDGFGDFSDSPVQTAPPGGGQQFPTSSSFDDFGDFGVSSTTQSSFTPQKPTAPSPLKFSNSNFSNSNPSTHNFQTMLAPKPTTALRGPQVAIMTDESSASTSHLVASAAQQGGRWPAPASPLPLPLAPPPGSKPIDLFGGGMDDVPSSNSTQAISKPAGGNLGMDFLSAYSSPPPVIKKVEPAKPAVGGGSKPAAAGSGGLSAQDLSFFDSL